MAQNKTRPTKVSPSAFIKSVENDQRRRDAQAVLQLMKEVTGERPTMWGGSIIGFGYYKAVYDSGREVENMIVGFSPRKQNLVLYVGMVLDDEKLLAKLGKHKKGKGCLYINNLDDVDRGVLRQVVMQAVRSTRKRIGV